MGIVTASTPERIRIQEDECAALGYITEYMGASNIMYHLNKVYSKIKFDIDMECFFNEKDLNKNIILIGGPVNNRLTRRFLEEINIPFRFEGYTLVDELNNKRYDAVISNDNIETDYSLIVNWDNPFVPGYRTIMICGCRTIGCYAGVLFLTESFRELKLMKNQKNHVAIVKTKGGSYHVIGKPALVSFNVFDGKSEIPLKAAKPD